MRMPPLDTISFMEMWCQEMRAMHGGDDIHANVDLRTPKLHPVESPLCPPQDKDRCDAYQPTAEPAAASAVTSLHRMESPLRRSPRKIGQRAQLFSSTSPSISSPPVASPGTSSRQVPLMKDGDVLINARHLSDAVADAKVAGADKAGFRLASILTKRLFSEPELAESCSQGIRNSCETGKVPLDVQRMSALKEYVIAFCKKNMFAIPSAKSINAAVNSQVTYARKKIKRALKKCWPVRQVVYATTYSFNTDICNARKFY